MVVDMHAMSVVKMSCLLSIKSLWVLIVFFNCCVLYIMQHINPLFVSHAKHDPF